jgi:Zn-finger nucleic acid-binding protein
MSDRQGVEIDYCPDCRGVWLDRGELDKIIERSATFTSPPPPPGGQREQRPPQGGHYQDHRGHPQRKKKSLLGELFDF